MFVLMVALVTLYIWASVTFTCFFSVFNHILEREKNIWFFFRICCCWCYCVLRSKGGISERSKRTMNKKKQIYENGQQIYNKRHIYTYIHIQMHKSNTKLKQSLHTNMIHGTYVWFTLSCVLIFCFFRFSCSFV